MAASYPPPSEAMTLTIIMHAGHIQFGVLRHYGMRSSYTCPLRCGCRLFGQWGCGGRPRLRPSIGAPLVAPVLALRPPCQPTTGQRLPTRAPSPPTRGLLIPRHPRKIERYERRDSPRLALIFFPHSHKTLYRLIALYPTGG